MVSPSKKLQASAPFMVPETNVNFPLVVVQPSGWETQTPGLDEDELDEARTYETSVVTAVNHVSFHPRQSSVHDPRTQSSDPSSTVSPPTRPSSMTTILSSVSPSNGAKSLAPPQGHRSILTGNYIRPSHSAYHGHSNAAPATAKSLPDIDSIASSRASPVHPPPPLVIAPQPPAKVAETRGEKRRLDEEEHEDEEAAEVEKAMVDEEGDPEPYGRTLRSRVSNGSMDSRAIKRAKISELSSSDEGDDENEEEEEERKLVLRTSPRKVAAGAISKKLLPLLQRRSRPVAGAFVGSGRVVPVKERPFGEPTCHRCGNMKNKPACILHSDEGRCDKCIVDAQGCWWRKAPGVYQSLSGTTPQKKLVDPRDQEERKTKEGKKKQAEKATEKKVEKGKEPNHGTAEGSDSDNSDESDSDEQNEEDSRPLTRKSLRVASTALKPATTSASANVSTARKRTRVVSRSGGRKFTSAPRPKPRRISKRDRTRSRRQQSKIPEDESESESSESGSDSSSDSQLSESPPPPPPKALKGRAARREDPNPNQQLQRYEKAEAKVRDELWALSWEKERLLRTERRLQEELEEILAKKVQVRAGH